MKIWWHGKIGIMFCLHLAPRCLHLAPLPWNSPRKYLFFDINFSIFCSSCDITIRISSSYHRAQKISSSARISSTTIPLPQQPSDTGIWVHYLEVSSNNKRAANEESSPNIPTLGNRHLSQHKYLEPLKHWRYAIWCDFENGKSKELLQAYLISSQELGKAAYELITSKPLVIAMFIAFLPQVTNDAWLRAA